MQMPAYICTTCGTQYAPSDDEPPYCVICNEERQYVNPQGQSWTTLDEMRQRGKYRNDILEEENGLYSITTTQSFGIGQTAYLIRSQGFNLLFDCITYLDDATVDALNRLGGVHAIALSHPHYYSAQVEWADTFGASIFIHEDDQEWVMRKSERIRYWSSETLALAGGLRLHRLGGHFKGGTVLQWPDGANTKGVLLTGDIIQVVADRRFVSFMYSYPNLIPLPAKKVRDMAEYVSNLKFDRIYNAFHRIVPENGQSCVQKSAERYIAALEGRLFQT